MTTKIDGLIQKFDDYISEKFPPKNRPKKPTLTKNKKLSNSEAVLIGAAIAVIAGVAIYLTVKKSIKQPDDNKNKHMTLEHAELITNEVLGDV